MKKSQCPVPYKKLILGFALMVGLGCAHGITPVAMPSTANPATEMDSLKAERAATLQRQGDVLAPYSYDKAENHFTKAQEKLDKGADREDILEQIGLAKAYLNQTNEVVAQSKGEINEVVMARKAALDAGATKLPEQLKKVDRDMKSLANRLEAGKSIETKDISELQQKYQDLELAAIKAEKLGPAKNMLQVLKDQGARKVVENSYAKAEQQYNSAEKVIERDRTNPQAVNAAASAATMASQEAMDLFNRVKLAKNQTPEQNAMDLQAREKAAREARAAAVGFMTDSQRKDRMLNTQKKVLTETERENALLAEKEAFNRTLEEARAGFKPEEADVYRQGNNLIIRLKSIEFASGRAELPSAAMGSLNKVKDVIEKVGTEKVVVEGHTDSLGKADTNKTLSEKRAQSVANFFIADEAVTSSQIQSVGYGFEKPLASNKTKEGRAQNRRVDIVITPASQIE